MWSQLLLCALIGIAAASNNGWQSNQEYIYQVRGRTLTGLHDVANQYSGIVLRAKLAIRPQEDEYLTAKISNAKYAQVHENLADGWKSEIPEGHLQFKDFHLSEKPFQIKMNNGVVDQLIVDSEVENWEANIIKSFVSQIQLDTRAENVVKSHMNQLPEEGSNNAVFKTMEDTVTGEYETVYDIAPLPEYVLASQPWLAPIRNGQGKGDLIEIVKNKNFSSAEERPGYYYGLGEMGDFEPATNQMKDFFLRSSLSRAIISGNLRHYIIQSASTTNKIIVSPTLNSEQNGMVVSHLNLTLAEIKQCSGPFEVPQQHEKLGSLTYNFNTPFAQDQKVKSHGAQENQERNMYSSEERVYKRHPRSLMRQSESESVESSEEWAPEEANLNQPPNSPLLPLYVGYKGQSVKQSHKIDICESATKIAKQIGQEIEHPERIPQEQTLAKYVILSTVARIMSEKEMECASKKLYTEEEQGPKAQAWYAYRDAIAECGTGPALLTIQQFIKSKKIESEEAAEVVASMAQSVRQPTEKYMRAFQQLVEDDAVQHQAILNDTAILSYTSLVRKVYVDEEYSHNEFPVHSFGKFATESGKKFVEEKLIPELQEKLHQAVKRADSHKVLVYIRALGNVAHQRILEAFEPYLEGEKQCSQFQRLQMVVALDKLVEVEPKIARSVLYKIYQNQGEEQEVRVAAVYQLMRCAPSAGMLQRMAKYTNIDNDEQVNAAVKSIIVSAAQLETEEFSEFSENARSAQPLLTTQEYGVQYSTAYLRDFVQEEMNLSYKQRAHVYGSEDSSFPKGIKYALHAGLGGAERQLVNVRAMVSSIDELTNVFERQTEQYQKDNKQHKSHYQQAQKNQWSSESIAKLLKLENIEREQLEGSVLLQLAGGVSRFFTFDNQTLEDLPKVLEQYEQELRQGKQFQYTKFLNRYETAVSFPTEMGMPFFFTLDAPTLLHVQGQIRANAEPKAFNKDVIRRPDTITAQTEINTVVSTKIQAKLGFITVFDNQQYISGYDKNMQVQIPIKSKFEIDLKHGEIQAQLQAIAPEKNAQLLHYSSWPYTSQHNMLQLEHVANNQHTQIIYSEEGMQSQWNGIVGKETGMAFRVEYASEQKFLDAYWLYEQYQRNDAISALLAPTHDESIMHTKLNVYYDAKHSTSRQVQIRVGYESHYETEQGKGPKPELAQFSELPKDSKARQQQFAKMAASGIHSAQAYALDAEVEFDGQVHYRATVAQASGPVDSKARALLYLTKKSSNKHIKSSEIAAVAEADVPNTNGLDFNYALKFDPTTKARVEIAIGENLHSAAKFNIHAKLEQSESRKQYLKEHPRAEECRDEMKEGNQQLPACANMTQEANLLDRAHVQIQFENVGAQCRNATKKMYNALRYLAYFNLEENRENATGSGSEDKLEFLVRFEPDFESVNVTLQAPHLDAHIDNIRVNNWVKQVVAVHPVFGLDSRVMSELMGYDTFKPFCVVDQSAANTFDNKTYPVDLGNDWTVMMQYVPDYARTGHEEESYQEQQREYQHEQYSVLVRDSNKDQKEVKMTIRTPETEGRVIEIELKPEQQQSEHNAKVYVNQKQYQINNQHSTDIEDGLVQMYVLPDGDVKIEVEDSFYVIYDGERVKITPTHDKFRDAVRGLCGTFTGDESDDFLTPKNCIAADHEDFVQSYSLNQAGQRKYQSECYEQETIYANVISDRDAGRHQPQSKQHKSYNKHFGRDAQEETCTKHQTRYIEHEGQICFTVRPVPVCKQSCNEGEMIDKRVAVHCIEDSSVARLWQKQIQNGASPDFSHKASNNNLKMRVPESCTNH